MKNAAFEILLENLQSNLKTLNKYDFKIYDEENKEFFISNIYYDEITDKLYFKCEEDR